MKDEEVPGCFEMALLFLSVVVLLIVAAIAVAFLSGNIGRLNRTLHLQPCSFERLQIVCPPAAGNK